MLRHTQASMEMFILAQPKAHQRLHLVLGMQCTSLRADRGGGPAGAVDVRVRLVICTIVIRKTHRW